MTKRSPTTKDIGLLHQLFSNGQLTLAPEFQRNSVWPGAAKAYLIDTILNDRPIPLLFIQRTTSAQKGLPAYVIIDGQQRLRAIFEYLDNRFRLTQSNKNSKYYNKRFSDLSPELRDRIANYDLVVEELSGYSEADMFGSRRYRQELRSFAADQGLGVDDVSHLASVVLAVLIKDAKVVRYHFPEVINDPAIRQFFSIGA